MPIATRPPMSFSRINASTCLPAQLLAMQAPTLEKAYAVASAAEAARTDSAHGYRLYFMASGRFGSIDVSLEPHAFIVVGRHALSDVVLDGDPTIALRHLLVRATRLDDGCPRLSVIDLHTHLGFELANGRNERSMAATGPIAFRVGGYAIVALPGGERLPHSLPEPACSRALVPHPYRDAPLSSITLLPRAVHLAESSVLSNGAWTLAVRGMRGSAAVSVSQMDMQIGLLVGRAPKCNDVLRNAMNDGISRVHLFLRGGVAYDVASTQGTWIRGERVRSVMLDDDGSEMRLGTGNPVFLRWFAS
jgi:hypothetical protein